jgi:hypothetical protein
MRSGEDVSKKLAIKNVKELKKQLDKRNSSGQKDADKERRPRFWKVAVKEMIDLESTDTRLRILGLTAEDHGTSTMYEKYRRRRKMESREGITAALAGTPREKTSLRKASGKAYWEEYERSSTERKVTKACNDFCTMNVSTKCDMQA